MGREFVEFPAELDRRIRSQVAKESNLTDATVVTRWLLRGSELSFYRSAWLACLEHISPAGSTRTDRFYFVVQRRERRRRFRLVPMANAAGSVDRANRECKLTLPGRLSELESTVIEYLNFYYGFTPQYDPLLANLDEGPTHFNVPLTVDDLQFDAADASIEGAPGGVCSDMCLARGAVWHYLDRTATERFVAIRLRIRRVPYPRITGRMVIQFRRGLFAADFRLPSSTNIPALGNPELLYESKALRGPTVYPQDTLRIHGYLDIGLVFGLGTWPQALIVVSTIAIAAFLGGILYTTHMDKIFNWLFWLCPRGRRTWLAEKLAKRVSQRDRELIAQDTFRKRAWWALRRLFSWTVYFVLAFASVQIALNVLYGMQSASANRIILTLFEQAAINIPLILYVLVRIRGLIENLDPVADGVLSAQLLFWFHAAMVLIVIKGIYRVWAFTVDASPHAFYRRLPITNRHSADDVGAVFGIRS